MKNKIIAFVIIVVIGLTVFMVSDFKNEITPEELSQTFIEYVFTATPESMSKIYPGDDYSPNKEVLEKLSGLTTDEIKVSLFANRIIAMSAVVAEEFNSNVVIQDYVIKKIQVNDKKTHIDFEARFIVQSLDTIQTFEYPLKGQIGMIKNDEETKVFALKLFTIGILDHKYKK